MDLKARFEKAKTSSFHLKLLNLGLIYMIPFNKPHGFKILRLSDHQIVTFLPYKRKNLNHIRGLHACALATLCEFTTGVMLISKLGFDKYRIILKNLEVEYLYQGKKAAIAEFQVADEWLSEKLYEPLKSSDSTIVECPVNIFDTDKNHLVSAKVSWQFKPWEKVKTKVG